MSARNVLIVEDEAIVQMHLERIVADLGHHVSGTARSLRQALECADREPPELVLMDVNIQGAGDGIDAARALRQRHDCAVVFATAYADDETISRSATVGASSYLVKPFTNAGVRAAIQTAFAEHDRQQRELTHERSLAQALTRASETTLVTDGRGLLRSVSGEADWLIGSGADVPLGRAAVELLVAESPEDAEALRTAIARALDSCERIRLEAVGLRRCDGEPCWADVAVEPIDEGEGQVSGVVVAIRAVARPQSEQADVRSRGPHRRFGAGSRILFYSHDTFGLGHLHRNMNLLRSVLRTHPGASALLITGSPAAHRYELPPGADYVKLPAVQKVAPERYEARTLGMSSGGVRTLRRNLLLRTIQDYDPDVVVVDHAPLGMKGEMRPALEWLGERGGCRRVLGLRDITDDPDRVIEHWTENGIYDAIEELYDDLVVYGAREIYDPVVAYQLPESIASRAVHLGYVCDERGQGSEPRSQMPGEPVVAVSIGGGDGAASVIELYLEMLRTHRRQVGFRSEILPGPLVEPGALERLREAADGLPVTFREFMPATAGWFASADLVVSTGGYNTTTQLIGYARRAIVIPRSLHRLEQVIRAKRLEELGLLTCLPPANLGAERLFETIQSSLATSAEPLREGRAKGVVPLDGAANFAAFCGELWHAERPGEES